MGSGVVPRHRLSSPLRRRSSKRKLKKSAQKVVALISSVEQYGQPLLLFGIHSKPFSIRRELLSIQSCGPPRQALLSRRRMVSRSPAALKNSSCYYCVRFQTITVAPKHYQSTEQDVHSTITTLANGHHSSSTVIFWQPSNANAGAHKRHRVPPNSEHLLF
jgi:hypothetical protein